jgi:anti-sigma factor RsiW
MSSKNTQRNRELADLLPFYVIGKLSLTDTRRVEAALATDEALRRELALIEEEQAATVQANQMLGLPSARAADRFLAMLEAEPERRSSGLFAGRFVAWVGERLRSLTQRQLAYAGIAAALLVIAQAGFIGVLWGGPGGTTFTQASVSGAAGQGSFAAVAFAPEAKLSDISALLDEAHATIVEGPKPGGLYVVRVGPRDMAKADRDAAIAKLGAQKSLVRFVAPSQ